MKFWQADIPEWELRINKILAKAWHKNGRKPDISIVIADKMYLLERWKRDNQKPTRYKQPIELDKISF